MHISKVQAHCLTGTLKANTFLTGRLLISSEYYFFSFLKKDLRKKDKITFFNIISSSRLQKHDVSDKLHSGFLSVRPLLIL